MRFALRVLPVVTLLSAAALPADLPSILAKPILDPQMPLVEVQVYTASRIPPLLPMVSAAEWRSQAARLRERVLTEVILRGEARRWRDSPARVEWLGTLTGGKGYRIRKLRFEAVPGLWVPAMLYEPLNIVGKVPVVLNVNGHEMTGAATPYIQERCINLAKRGMLALTPEWFGRGQFTGSGFLHYRLNQLDLVGTSGVSLFHFSLQRSLDLLLSLEHADKERVAVTGLSGGGWQTIFLSALDPRVRLANPVAGYSSYLTRAQFPLLDLGDSEQTPSDLASILDYTHLTAMMAPRPTLLTYNAKDDCCFRAANSLAPLLQAAAPVFRLLDARNNLRSHVNFDPGHNYGRDNREAFYRLLRDHFFGGSPDFEVTDLPSGGEVRTAEELRVPLPVDNLDFHKLALQLSTNLPRWQEPTRSRLGEIVRAKQFDIQATEVERAQEGDLRVTRWRLRLSGEWTIPAIELSPMQPKATVLLVADSGRSSLSTLAARLLAERKRVVAVDPFYFGESKIPERDWLFALLVGAIGDRPLGIQASQMAAAARWLQTARGFGPVEVISIGPRSSLFSLIAAGLEANAIASLQSSNAFSSLKEILTRDITARQMPELFCFGLLEEFDITGLKKLVAPRPVSDIGLETH